MLLVRLAALAAAALAPPPPQPVAFSSMLIGGGEYGADQAAMLDAFISLAGGAGRARVGIVAAASADPQSEFSYFGGLLSAHGAAFVYDIPIFDTPAGRANNSNADVVAVLRTLTGVFQGGGDQMKVRAEARALARAIRALARYACTRDARARSLSGGRAPTLTLAPLHAHFDRS